ncbi:MAG: Ig-like domain-containing protein, partial [Gemmatimonadaceae bacterium]
MTQCFLTIAFLSNCGGGSDAPQLPAAVASVAVTLNLGSIRVGQTSTLTSIVRDANGNVLNDRTVAWTSSSPAIAQVAVTGNGATA